MDISVSAERNLKKAGAFNKEHQLDLYNVTLSFCQKLLSKEDQVEQIIATSPDITPNAGDCKGTPPRECPKPFRFRNYILFCPDQGTSPELFVHQTCDHWWFDGPFWENSFDIQGSATRPGGSKNRVFFVLDKYGRVFCLKPIGSMYGILTYIWLKVMVNVGTYSIHGAYGKGIFLYF